MLFVLGLKDNTDLHISGGAQKGSEECVEKTFLSFFFFFTKTVQETEKREKRERE